MKDSFGREIDYLRISVTDRCNLRCVYCMPEEGVCPVSHEDILSYEEIEELTEIFSGLGISKIKLTGGEPLVRRNLPVLVRKLKQLPGIKNVTLTTNGILLKEQLPALMEAGLDGVNISIDSLNEQEYARFTRGGCLSRALEGLEAACSRKGLGVKVNCVSFWEEENSFYERVKALGGLAGNYPVSVRFIEMMPIGYGRKFQNPGEKMVRDVLEKEYGPLKPYGGKLGNGPCQYYTLSGFAGKIGFISAVSHQFCSSCNRVRLTAAGYLKTCLQYEQGVDLKRILRQNEEKTEIRKKLETAICRAVREKPRAHVFGEGNSLEQNTERLETHTMSQIGG